MERETLVLDASVIVKWFCEEEYTDIALSDATLLQPIRYFETKLIQMTSYILAS
jgi:predicted nucleic acid-binding protein